MRRLEPARRSRPPVRRATPDHGPSLSSPETLRDLVQNLREGVYITNAAGEILDANPAMLAMFGVRSKGELAGRRVQEWIDPGERVQEHVILARRGLVRDFEFTFRRPSGEIRTVIDTAFMRRGAKGEILYYGIFIDITERKRLEQQLLDLGERDPLTGCLNRRFLPRFEASARTGGWCCIVVDVDHFKEYNDRYGHERGDQVLVRTGRFLASLCRAGDAVVRLGGDEFVILLAGLRGPEVRRVVARLTRAGRAGSPVPFSLGWASRWKGEPLKRTIARADRRLIGIRIAERGEHRRRSPAG